MDDKEVKLKQLMKEKGIKLFYKQDSLLMRIIAQILFFNKGFMTDYITTIGSTIYVPRQDLYMSNQTTVHETVHKCDYDTYGTFTVGLGYILPQVIGILFWILIPLYVPLGMYHSTSWFYCFIGLIFILPLPSPGRKWLEMRGYAATMAVMFWEGRFGDYEEAPEWIEKHFTGSTYYWMWPFKSQVKKELEEWKVKISTDQILYEIPVLKEVKKVLLPERFEL